MSILGWVILGGLAGWIAASILGERQSCGANVIVGIVGALLGGFLFSLAGGAPVTGFNLWSLFVAVIGSIVFIWILRALRKQ